MKELGLPEESSVIWALFIWQFYLLNNDDRHGQNWGFFMENGTGKLTGYCPLFDHDHGFSSGRHIFSQTTEKSNVTFYIMKEW